MVLGYILLTMHLLNPLLLTVTFLVWLSHTITVIDTQALHFSATTERTNAAMDTLVHVFLDLCENLFDYIPKMEYPEISPLRQCLLQLTQDYTNCICHSGLYFCSFKEDHGLAWLGQECLGMYLFFFDMFTLTEYSLYIFDGVKINTLFCIYKPFLQMDKIQLEVM